ncbi:MAG: Serine/threonine-protein kinase PknD [Chloroflexi bacterium ADurb.Bin180]|nr:MAG: Serine/threonine-protein kinase PknD [Chloroflexi bacterium ADurb.Bin180]
MESSSLDRPTLSGALDRPLLSVLRINGWKIILLLLVVLLVFTRLYDLGNRAYCHDESTHAWEPWKLITGQGYRFDPVYHGPFLYHATALVYWLFGDSDTTARIASALLAILSVLLVWPLRKWLGKAGALFTMFLLTLSPSMMFRGRFIRHDIFVIAPTMAVVVAFFHYVTDRRQRWLYVIAGGLALTFCAKANSFINGAIFGAFWVGALLVDWWKTRRPLRELPEFDLAVLMATLALPLLTPLVLMVLKLNPRDYSDAGLWRIRGVLLVLVAISAVIGLWWKRKVWPIAAAIYYAIYIPLYTTMFTNGQGLETGFTGMVGHWLGEQGVARGGQPWFYFYFLNVIYEFLPLILALLAILYYLYRLLRELRPQAAEGESQTVATAAPPFVGFILFWGLGTFAFWTWAAEKMPWQNMHLVLNLCLVAGWFLGQVWQRADWRKLLKEGFLPCLVLLPVMLFGNVVWVVTLAGRPKPFSGMELEQLYVTLRFLLGLIVEVVAGALLVAGSRRFGWRGLGRVLLAALFVVLTAATIRIAVMLTFINQNYATEFLQYAAATPDTADVMAELGEIRRLLPDGEPLRIAYDNDSQQPFFWYLRELPNVTFFTGDGGLSGVHDVVIIGLDNETKLKAQLAGRYVRRNYRLIWWPYEDVYRNLTLRKLWDDLRSPERLKFWWNIFWWRKYPESTALWPSVHRFALYVRKDLASRLWVLGPDVPGVDTSLPEDDYEKQRLDLAAIQAFGSSRELNDPKGVAVDHLGRVYVVNTRNHRVEVYSADGQLVQTIGSQGTGPGQFQEPWGIAVAPDGHVYVADTWNHRIEKFDAQGRFVATWGTFGDTGGLLGAPDVLYGPRDIAVTPDGNLIVSDTGNKRLIKFSPEGTFIAQWGGGGSLPGQFLEPCGVAVDAAGNIYVADVWNHRIQKLSADGVYQSQIAVVGWESESPVNKPYLVADQFASVYVTQPDYHRVVKFDSSGRVLSVWGLMGTDERSLNTPSDITLDAQGNVYVVDSGNNRVVKYPALH